MSTNNKVTVIRCRCGEVEFQLMGKPILTTVCHCDDCQRAAHELEALPNASPILDAASGTPYVLYRRDRVVCVKGSSLQQEHRLDQEPFTKRVVSTCCHSPMYLDFEKGHWLSFFRDRFGEAAPRIQMRTQTRFIPKTVPVPGDVPHSATYPFGFIRRLLGSMVAMKLFGGRQRRPV